MNRDTNPSHLRLLLLTDGLAPFVTGGMQQHSVMLAKHLAPLVRTITLMHCGPINGEVPEKADVLKELENPENVEVIGIPFEDQGKLPGHYLRASLKLSQNYFNEVGVLNQFDAIYAQGLTGNAFLGKHSKLVVNLHGLNMFQPAFSWKERVAKMLLKPTFRKQIRRAWRNVSLGGRLSNILLEQGASKESIVVVPNGIESTWVLSEEQIRTRFMSREGLSIKFVMVGRNDYVKGLHVLREALQLLDAPIELHMIGDWPKWDSGIHRVIYHGIIREKEILMQKLDDCDVLLLPSLSEGMPTVVLEAKARGLRIIGTNVGAMSELENELLFPGDSVELAAAILGYSKTTRLLQLPSQFCFEEVARITCDALSGLKA